jgi:nicotinate-nucleotide adenylyltransferase
MKWLRPPGPLSRGLRIGLLGGSFNPAHEGHLYVAETALKRLGLDYVWFLVAPQNPLKPENGMAPLAERMAAARRLIGRHPRLIVSDAETLLGTRYTADTLKALHKRFGEARFVWLMGSDNLEQFHHWRNWADIVRRVPIAVVLRPGSTLAPLKAKAVRRFGLARRLRRPPAILPVDGHRNQASATAIRALGGAETAMLK